MKRVLSLLLVLGLIACATSVANAVTVIGGALNNGDLDATTPTLIIDNAPPGPGPEDLFLPKPSVWQNIGTRTITGPYEDEMSSEPWSGPAPTPVTTDGSGAASPIGCGGLDCGVFFKPFTGGGANGPATGHLQQDNPVVPGSPLYTMTGWAGAEANALMADAQFAIEFLDAGSNVIPLSGTTLSLLPTLFVPNGEAFNYKKYTLSAVAPGGAVSVRARASMIGATSNPAGGGQAFVIDDFTLTAVPEPASIALGLLGVMGLLGFIRRR